MSTPRKIVQIAFNENGSLFAVAEDGTLWLATTEGAKDVWQQLRFPPLPPREDEHCEVSGAKLGATSFCVKCGKADAHLGALSGTCRACFIDAAGDS